MPVCWEHLHGGDESAHESGAGLVVRHQCFLSTCGAPEPPPYLHLFKTLGFIPTQKISRTPGILSGREG